MKNLNGEEISNSFNGKQKKLKPWQIILTCIIGIAIVAPAYLGVGDDLNESENKEVVHEIKLQKNTILTCDGINTTADCELNGKQYTLYKYYPKVEEVSHTEKVTKYKTDVVGYCTLCNDSTYSPSCATGRGACSHHGGVAQWNAPIYNQVAYYEEVKVIDTPAVAERYEIIEK